MSTSYVGRLGQASAIAIALVSIVAAGAAQADEWAYSGAHGPGSWGGDCQTSAGQSPIKLPDGVTQTLDPVSSLGTASKYTAVPEHHTVFFKPSPAGSGGTLRYGGRTYQLKQFHYHTPSEHQWIGDPQAAIELHFVHEAVPAFEGRGKNLVLAVLGASRTASRAGLSTLASKLVAGDIENFTANTLLPTQRTYASYEGSLTTPDCTPNVTWVVFRNKIDISADDLGKFVAANGPNARPIRPNAAAIVDFAGQQIKASGASVQPGAGMAYNNDYGGWRLASEGSSFQVTFQLGAVPTTDLSLALVHLTSAKWPDNGYSPINIDVNGTPLKAGFDPARAHAGRGEDTRNYVSDRFTIPPGTLRVIPANNTIKFTLQPGAQTHYWIRSLRLERGAP